MEGSVLFDRVAPTAIAQLFCIAELNLRATTVWVVALFKAKHRSPEPQILEVSRCVVPAIEGSTLWGHCLAVEDEDLEHSRPGATMGSVSRPRTGSIAGTVSDALVQSIDHRRDAPNDGNGQRHRLFPLAFCMSGSEDAGLLRSARQRQTKRLDRHHQGFECDFESSSFRRRARPYCPHSGCRYSSWASRVTTVAMGWGSRHSEGRCAG